MIIVANKTLAQIVLEHEKELKIIEYKKNKSELFCILYKYIKRAVKKIQSENVTNVWYYNIDKNYSGQIYTKNYAIILDNGNFVFYVRGSQFDFEYNWHKDYDF